MSSQRKQNATSGSNQQKGNRRGGGGGSATTSTGTNADADGQPTSAFTQKMEIRLDKDRNKEIVERRLGLLNDHLEGVSKMYFGSTDAIRHLITSSVVVEKRRSASADRNSARTQSPIDLLTSPDRKPHVIDLWGPKEIALFEGGICKLGKDFNRIQRVVKTKTTKEIVDFYYLWKKSARYRAWKEYRDMSETIVHSVLS